MFRFIKTNSKRSKKICRIILLIILVICLFAKFFIASLAKDNDEIKQILAAENLEQEVKVDMYTFRNYQGPHYDFERQLKERTIWPILAPVFTRIYK